MSCSIGRGGYNPQTSIFAGMTTAALQAYLADAQAAYMTLSLGGKAVTLSYAQGDGSKSVTYQQSNVGQLTQLILQLQAQLGINPRPRRAMRFRY